MGGGSPDTSKQDKAAEQQTAISQQQLDLEKQRLASEQQNSLQKEKELAYLQQQIQAQNDVYTQQIGLLSGQNDAAQALAEKQTLVSAQQNEQTESQRKLVEAENARSQYISQQNQAKASENMTGLLSSGMANKQKSRLANRGRKTSSALSSTERTSLLGR